MKQITLSNNQEALVAKKSSGVLGHLKKHWMLYSMALPGMIFFIMFRYIPLLGSIIAFQDYQILNGIFKSPWVGWANFEYIFRYPDFLNVLRNTILISTYQLVFGFPAPIILAILLNEIRAMVFKRFLQTFFYLPHFLSWVIIAGLVFELLSLQGIVNSIRHLFGAEPILFMQKAEYFKGIVVASAIWRETGWSAIIYLAAIAGINPSLYEAATMDGAGKVRQIVSITLPSLIPTIMVLFLLKIGSFLELGFEQVYVFLTPMTNSTGDIIDTYVYRVGALGGQYSITTAIGLFQSVIGLILLWSFNKLSNKTTGQGLW